ncbi:MAG: M48 family metalloprotease [Chloroflexi bacterium]|nr:M48 family metalloprotease [Chloroflexota bacterium]
MLGLNPNFFVTEADVTCLNGQLSGRTLYCSLPLCRILTLNELSAIIGHELAHFKGSDTKFSKSFYPIYRGTALSIASLQSAGGGFSGSVALLPALAIFGYFLECFSVAESEISRDRELVADREGANISDRASASTAQVKIHAFAGLWDGFQSAAVGVLRQGKAFVNASLAYAQAVSDHANPEALKGIAETQVSHPTNSHPPLGSRLQSLGCSLEDLAEAALAVNPIQPAVALIADPETKEKELSLAYQVIIARREGINLTAIEKGNREPERVG